MRSRLTLVIAMAILAASVVAGTSLAGEDPRSGKQAAAGTANPLAAYGFSDIQEADCVIGFDENSQPIYGAAEDCAVDTDSLPEAVADHAAPANDTVEPVHGDPVDGDEADGGEPVEEPGDTGKTPSKPKKNTFSGKKVKPNKKKSAAADLAEKVAEPKRKADGRPTNDNPTLTIADTGSAPVGVPNFIIDSFSIPPFLLPIYQACGTQYNIPWQVLASINRIETAFGTNLNVSSAGALGWMQFMPATWKAYGVDANGDGKKDPYNPVDAICAAAHYLDASGGVKDLRRAIFAYNHADWYVDEVILYAEQYAELPADLVGSLTGLTEGARFPVAAKARYADDISEREASKRAAERQSLDGVGNVADVVADSPTRRGINIYTRKNAPIIAVNDGVIRKIGENEKLGKHIVLEDAYGNRFTYANLGSIEEAHPVARKQSTDGDKLLEEVAAAGEAAKKGDDEGVVRATPVDSSRVGSNYLSATNDPEALARGSGQIARVDGGNGGPVIVTNDRGKVTRPEERRKFALPARENNVDRAAASGQLDALMDERFPGYEKHKGSNSILKFNPKTMTMRPLRKGSNVVAGTLLGTVGSENDSSLAPHLHFAIRPAGRGAPKIDPKPILDGWKLLEATEIYRAQGKNPFKGGNATVGQILLMSKEQLQRRVLANSKLDIYGCGRQDIKSGFTDRRVLALLEYLTARGFRLTITSLTCGHSYYSKSGNVSHHSVGSAVDIAAINGQVIHAGNQGAGSLTHAVLGEIMRLQGAMRPDQLISLLALGGPSFAMADHDDHIHVGYRPAGDDFGGDSRNDGVLKPEQWKRLTKRLGQIENPTVPKSKANSD